MKVKTCAKCQKELTNPRAKFCDDSCKYWFNAIKKDDERGLPPFKKRNKEWFSAFSGVTTVQRGQGKRCGHMVMGSMSAMIPTMNVVYKPYTKANVIAHFVDSGIWNIGSLTLGDGTRVTKKAAMAQFSITESEIQGR